MARPADHDKRRDLARAAVEVLQREGTDLAMAGLAEALGLKRPTLLYHFPTKGHILELALVDLLTEQAQHVLEKVADHTHPIDRLYAHMRAIHGFHHGHEGRLVFLTQAIAATAGARLPAILEAGALVFELQRADIVERIRVGIRDGTVAPCNPEALFACVRALVDGLMVQQFISRRSLGPAHDFVWEHVLVPLKTAAPSAQTKRAQTT